MEPEISYGAIGNEKRKPKTKPVTTPPFRPKSGGIINGSRSERRVRSHSDSVDRILDHMKASGGSPFFSTPVKTAPKLHPQDMSPLMKDKSYNSGRSITDDDEEMYDQENLRRDKLRRQSSKSRLGSSADSADSSAENVVFNLIITTINTIMCVPCLYGECVFALNL